MNALAAAAAGWTVGWGFSSVCDMKCPFCYSATVRKDTAVRELPLEVARAFLQNNRHQVRAINFGTGECFLSPNFTALLSLCHEVIPGVSVAVTTNGSLADLAGPALQTVGKTVTECDVSLDFADPDEHDAWRKRPGAARRAWKAIEVARSLGIETTVVMIGTQQTLRGDNPRRMMALCERWGVPLRVNVFMPTRGDFSFSPSREDIVGLLQALGAWSPRVNTSDRLFSHFLGTSAEGPGAATARQRSCRILPDGSITPSTYLIDGDWTCSQPLESVDLAQLEHVEAFLRYRDRSIPAACGGCPVREDCRGGSVERRWLWTGSLAERDPLCTGAPEVSTRLSPQRAQWKGPLIHLDYLPTIIALPPASTGG